MSGSTPPNMATSPTTGPSAEAIFTSSSEIPASSAQLMDSATPVDSAEGPPTVEEVQKDGLDEGHPLWEQYNSEARGYDEELVGRSVRNLDALLVFSGLFSAILTAFIIESYQWLEPDPAEQTVDLLRSLYALQTGAERVEERPFEAPVSLVWVNAVWFASLAFTLSASLVILLLKQVMDEFSLRKANGTVKEQALLRQHRFDGVVRWRIIAVIEFLPTLFHTALGLFFTGLILLLETLHQHICIMMGVIGGSITLLYLVVTVSPLFGASPFRSPLLLQLKLQALRIARFFSHPSVHALLRIPPLKQDHVHTVADFEKVSIQEKTRDLTGSCIEWLATTSTNRVTVATCLRLIASIPFSMDEGYSKLVSKPLMLELVKHTVDAIKVSADNTPTEPYAKIMAIILRQASHGRLPAQSVSVVNQMRPKEFEYGNTEYTSFVMRSHSPEKAAMMHLQTCTMVLYSVRGSARWRTYIHAAEGRLMIANEAMKRSQSRNTQKMLELAYFLEAYSLLTHANPSLAPSWFVKSAFLDGWETNGSLNWQRGHWCCGVCHFVADLVALALSGGEPHAGVLFDSAVFSLGILQYKTFADRKPYMSNYRGVQSTPGFVFINPRLGLLSAMRTLVNLFLEHKHKPGSETLGEAAVMLSLVLSRGWDLSSVSNRDVSKQFPSNEVPSTDDLLRLIKVIQMVPDPTIFGQHLLDTVRRYLIYSTDGWSSKDQIIAWVLEFSQLVPHKESWKLTTRDIIVDSGVPWPDMNPTTTRLAMELVAEFLRDTNLEFADDTADKIRFQGAWKNPLVTTVTPWNSGPSEAWFTDGSLDGELLDAVADLLAIRLAMRMGRVTIAPDQRRSWIQWGNSLRSWTCMGLSWNPTNLSRFNTANAAALQRLIKVLVDGYHGGAIPDETDPSKSWNNTPQEGNIEEMSRHILPGSWEERYTADGRRYFHKRDLGVNSWKDPREGTLRENRWSLWPSGWRSLPKVEDMVQVSAACPV